MTGPRVIDVRDTRRAANTLDSVLEHLNAGGLLAYPTETVYGFGGLPTRSAIEGLVALKKRDPAKPMLLLVQDREAVSHLRWTPEAIELADVFWPGSVTLVLSDPGARYPEGVRGSAGSVAIRVSPHPLVRELVRGLRGPILSTSANRPGETPALDAQDALGAAVAAGAGEEFWVLDGGSSRALSAVHDHRLLGAGARGSTPGHGTPGAGSLCTSRCPSRWHTGAVWRMSAYEGNGA